MTENTINDDMTMSGSMGTLLAGRYHVIKQLGQGGMGSVWLAEDTKLDGFKVAIKMLPSVLVNNKRAYAQVKAEALVSLKLSHPNIVTVRAFEEEGGNPFLVMDYIDGQTLDDYLAEKGKLTEEETIRLLKPVAAALDYAHSQGVVHRDVKPGNVMIRKDGTPFVLDFGIAREIQETMTRVTGKLSSGTLLYMSPEQLHGAAPKPAQDIYSFAAMAYECLTGRPPFSRGQIEYQIEHDKPSPLPGNSAIFHGVMAGLEKTPEARPATCAAVLSVGACALRDRVADGAADRTMSRRKESMAWARLAILGLLFVLAFVGGLWLLDRSGYKAIPGDRGAPTGAGVVTNDVMNSPNDPPSVPSDDGDAGRRRLELAAETAAYALAAEMENEAALIAANPAEVREFFAAEIREFEQARKAGDDAKADSKNVMATNFFALAKVQVNELKNFIEARAHCLAARVEAQKAKQSADAVDAKSMLVMRYSEAHRMLDDVLPLMVKRNFGQAIDRAQSARSQFVALRADVIKLSLDEAKRHKSAEQWDQCLAEAEKVLGWEKVNVQAASLKEEAERNLVPTLRFVAKIGDREVKATAVIDGKVCTSPWIWNENLQPGSRVPSSDVAAEYTEGEKRYVGMIKSQIVDWKGLRSVPVMLSESVLTEADRIRKRLIGRWKHESWGSVKTLKNGSPEYGVDGARVNMSGTVEFRADGVFVATRHYGSRNADTKSECQGHWTIDGDRLLLRYKESSVNGYSYANSIPDSKGEKIIWNGDDEFVLRGDPKAPRRGDKHGVYTLTDAEGYYDETGCWHYMIEWEVPGMIWGKDTYREEMVYSPTVYTRMK